MNDSDLDGRLKSVPVPERPDEYWEDFPTRVSAQFLRVRRESAPQSPWRPQLAWAGGFALAMALAISAAYRPLHTASVAVTKHERALHAELAQFKTSLHLLMFNPHGMSYLLADAN